MSQTEPSLQRYEAFDLEPRAIETALRELWRATAEGDASLFQVRALTLVIFVPAALAAEELLHTIERVAVRHPGRAIALLAEDHPGIPARAQATILCRRGSGDQQICGELIAIRGGDGGAALPNLAAALLVPGVPTFVWWLDDPQPGDPRWEQCVELADRVLLDSRRWRRPMTGLRQLAALAQSDRHVIYTDLHWAALTPWRRQIAQCFDVPAALPRLPHLQSVTVRHGPRAHDRLAALLITGWLASRLGWRPVTGQDTHITLRGTHGNLTARLEAVATEAALHSLELTLPDARIELAYEPTIGCIHTTIALPGSAPVVRMARLPARTLADELADELGVQERDTVWEAALAAAAEIAAISGTTSA
ncbi:glucose-6-phosphate dehydrogenase assembly protein OpcA [Kallotenue papyrolyticum]|uniref:glucose-6-phosphate dehydrogenase assembly protein OpcA n=1 Tax=Kallotenue papyrolyticum TaxID=1325125 RepID=UPI0004785467|nr:glucose-6-phosphate dehydrogenase assembly protein OpcA [Kallotenue papyrolyticum]